MNQENNARKLRKYLKMAWLLSQSYSSLFHVGSYIVFPYIIK